MHVYLREDPVDLRMVEVDAEGLVPAGSALIPVAFFVRGNEQPSFRALLPPDTVEVLEDALLEPVTLGVLAEEPDEGMQEIRAMVGLAVPVGEGEEEEAESENEPWRASVGDPDAWRGESADVEEEPHPARTALLAFAPLVRLERRYPDDFGEELADLLEAALSGVTRSAIQARIDRMLGEL